MKLPLDIHEYSVLIEAAWHGRTALRASIMEKAIGTWYHQVAPSERIILFQWFKKHMKLDNPGTIERELQDHFLARYDPENQYRVQWGEYGRTYIAYRFGTHLHSLMHMKVAKEQAGLTITPMKWIPPVGEAPLKPSPETLDTIIGRNLYIRNLSCPQCPECNEKNQVQLLNANLAPAHWKCRTCKHYFTYEP